MGPSVPWTDPESTSEGLVWGSVVLIRFCVDGAQAWGAGGGAKAAHRCVTQVCQLREAHEGRYTWGCPRGTPPRVFERNGQGEVDVRCSGSRVGLRPIRGAGQRGVHLARASAFLSCLQSDSFPQGSPEETSAGPGALGRGLPGWEGCRPEGLGNALAWERVLRGGRGAELGPQETLPGGACGTRTDPGASAGVGGGAEPAETSLEGKAVWGHSPESRRTGQWPQQRPETDPQGVGFHEIGRAHV